MFLLLIINEKQMDKSKILKRLSLKDKNDILKSKRMINIILQNTMVASNGLYKVWGLKLYFTH